MAGGAGVPVRSEQQAVVGGAVAGIRDPRGDPVDFAPRGRPDPLQLTADDLDRSQGYGPTISGRGMTC